MVVVGRRDGRQGLDGFGWSCTATFVHLRIGDLSPSRVLLAQRRPDVGISRAPCGEHRAVPLAACDLALVLDPVGARIETLDVSMLELALQKRERGAQTKHELHTTWVL